MSSISSSVRPRSEGKRSATVGVALPLAAGVPLTVLQALLVHAAFASAVRNRDQREILRRRDVGAEQRQQCGREHGLTHRESLPVATRMNNGPALDEVPELRRINADRSVLFDRGCPHEQR